MMATEVDYARVVASIRGVGRSVHAKRAAARMTYAQAANEIGITRSTYWHLERGDGVNQRVLVAALEWLGGHQGAAAGVVVELGSLVREHRAACGKSFDRVVYEMGIARSTYWRLERNEPVNQYVIIVALEWLQK